MENREFAIILIACLMAWVLSGLVGLETRASDRQEGDVLVRLFGGTAEIASQSAMERADLYLHAGNGHKNGHEGESPEAHRLPLRQTIERLHGATAPTAHRHLAGAEEKELLPWFVIAVRLDRHNVEAWLDGAYWFYRTGQTGEAERLITEGIKHNPKDHRVFLERGILYHRMKQYDKSASDLRRAIRLYRQINEDSPFELKAARIFLGDAQQKLMESAK